MEDNIKNTVEVVEENIRKIIGDYRGFRNYFYEVLREWTDYYELNDLNNDCENIIIDLIIKLDDTIRERKRRGNYKNTKDMVDDINYKVIIKSILDSYRRYNLFVNSKESIIYLFENDPSLFSSLWIASKNGYTLDSINSTVLANLLYKQNQDDNYSKIYRYLYEVIVIFCRYYVMNIHDFAINNYR
jgi:hypothetical protein